jgi:3-oxoadipate enol-lactonase
MIKIIRSFATLCVCATLARFQGSAAWGETLVVPVNGSHLHVTVEGSGKLVVLLHGGFMDSTMWDAQAAALSPHFRVIRIDLRGFGRSPKTTQDYFPEDDIAAVLDKVNVERAAIVGISMGGGLAIDFALRHPGRVESLVLAEPGLSGWKWSAEVTETMEAVMKTAKEQGRDAAIEAFLRRPVFAAAKDKPAAYAAIRSQLQRNFSLEPQRMKAVERPAVDRLSEIRVPTLLMVAEHGGSDARAIAQKVAAAVTGAQLVTVVGSGHMINLERPKEFNRLILEFLSGRR